MKKSFSVRYSRRALEQLSKLDRSISALLINWIDNNLIGCSDPRFNGKSLKGSLKGNWRYRAGDYRILAKINDEEVLILTVNVGHRSEIYK